MTSLRFSLSLDAMARMHDILVCLGKFSETVSVEARRETLVLSTLNSSRSGYAAFTLDRDFFTAYHFVTKSGTADGRFTCAILNKALVAVFKSRLLENRGKETAVDRCEVVLQENDDDVSCRLVIKMVCSHGVTKSYHLMYESAEVMHALFDASNANNSWSIRAGYLREFIEYFAAKAEQLDIYCDDGKAMFISFTEKVVNNKNEVLKQPLKTTVALDLTDFDSFDSMDKTHIIVSVKDFKAIVIHASTIDAVLRTQFSSPGHPLSFGYSEAGLECSFILMTAGSVGAERAEKVSTTRVRSGATSRASTRAPSVALGHQGSVLSVNEETGIVLDASNPRARRAARKLGQNESVERSGPLSGSNLAAEDSLFVPREDEDRQWDPEHQDDNEEALVWNPSLDKDAVPWPTLRDSGQGFGNAQRERDNTSALPPTQRISQIKGLW